MSTSKSLLPLLLACLVMVGCSGDQANTDDTSEATTQEQQDQTAQNQPISPKVASSSTNPGDVTESPALKIDLPNPMENTMLVTTSRETIENNLALNAKPDAIAATDESNNELVSDESSGTFVSTLRLWKDDKGLFSTSAELLAVSISTREVRLLKENGVTITVPFERLSAHDQNFVSLFVDAKRKKVKKVTPQLVEAFD